MSFLDSLLLAAQLQPPAQWVPVARGRITTSLMCRVARVSALVVY